jgi:hypothetical protein
MVAGIKSPNSNASKPDCNTVKETFMYRFLLKKEPKCTVSQNQNRKYDEVTAYNATTKYLNGFVPENFHKYLFVL